MRQSGVLRESLALGEEDACITLWHFAFYFLKVKQNVNVRFSCPLCALSFPLASRRLLILVTPVSNGNVQGNWWECIGRFFFFLHIFGWNLLLRHRAFRFLVFFLSYVVSSKDSLVFIFFYSLSLSLYTKTQICSCVHTHTHECMCVSVCVFVLCWVCVHICIRKPLYVCMYVSTYAFKCVQYVHF